MERTEHTGSIKQIFQAHQPHLPWSGDFPEEAKQFFSLAFLWDRPKERKILAIPIFAGFKDYVAAYLDLVDRAEPVRSGAKLDSILTSSTVLSAVSCRKNPGQEMFTRFCGEEWIEEYIHGFLFNWERKLAQLVSNKN